MRKSKVFTPEMDEIIRTHYPIKGGRETARAVNDRFGTQFRTSSMWDRARILGVTGKKGGDKDPLQPRWDTHPSNFVGPCPHTVGAYLITSKSEPKNFKGSGKRTFQYSARCRACGKDTTMLQHSLLKAKKHGAVGCKSCAQIARSRVIRQNKDERDTAAHRAFSEWVWVMKKMPITPIEYVPQHMRFDSRR